MKRQEGRGRRREISRKPHQSPAELSLVRGTNVRVKTKVTSQVLGDVWSQGRQQNLSGLGYRPRRSVPPGTPCRANPRQDPPPPKMRHLGYTRSSVAGVTSDTPGLWLH